MPDYIFPLASVENLGSGDHPIARPLGTGFLVRGHDGFALTAGHVVDGEVNDKIGALFLDSDGYWRASPVREIHRHPDDDLALIRIEGVDWDSELFVTSASEQGSAHYSMWGYPLDIMNEEVREGRAVLNPVLIFSEGHIRRSMTDIRLPGISGRRLYELGTVAGSGCSGSPICIRQPGRHPFEVVGVYIGERYSESDHVSVGFAVRSEAILEMWPQLAVTAVRGTK